MYPYMCPFRTEGCVLLLLTTNLACGDKSYHIYHISKIINVLIFQNGSQRQCRSAFATKNYDTASYESRSLNVYLRSLLREVPWILVLYNCPPKHCLERMTALTAWFILSGPSMWVPPPAAPCCSCSARWSGFACRPGRTGRGGWEPPRAGTGPYSRRERLCRGTWACQGELVPGVEDPMEHELVEVVAAHPLEGDDVHFVPVLGKSFVLPISLVEGAVDHLELFGLGRGHRYLFWPQEPQVLV